MLFQIKLLKIEREDALKHRDRLSIMREEKDAFLSKLKEARMSVYKVGMILNYRQNRIAFQWDAYRPLVDRIPACTAQGVYLPGGVSQHAMGQAPPSPPLVNRMTTGVKT